jgi:hypothetical protein
MFLNPKYTEKFILMCFFILGWSLTWYVILTLFAMNESQKSRIYMNSDKSRKTFKNNKKSIKNSDKNTTDMRGGDLNLLDNNSVRVRNERWIFFLVGAGLAAAG